MSEVREILKIAGVALAVYLVMKYMLPYVIPFLIAYVLVHLLNPVTELLHRKLRWKKTLIVSILMTALLVLFTMLFYSLYCLLVGQVRKIALNFDYYYDCFCGVIDSCCLFAEENFGIEVAQMRAFVYSSISHATEQIRVYIVPSVVNHSVRYLKKVVDAGIFLLMLFVAVVLLMKDYDEMRGKLEQYSLYQHFHRIVQRMWKQGGMYMKAQGIIIGVIIVICAAGLWMLGNPYFLLLGIVVGLMDALPFIGTGTVLVPVAVYMAFSGSYGKALGYAALFLVTYVAREFLEPRLIGAKLGVYPFVMVVVVYAGLYLYGTAGVVLGPVSLLLIMEILRELREEQK